MGLNIGVLIQALIWAAGVIWCKEMLPKWREHSREFRTGGWVERISLVLMWGLTGVILFYCLRGVYFVGRPIVEGLLGMIKGVHSF